MSFGAPRYYPQLTPLPAANQVRTATDELMRELAARSGRHYVDRYAATFRS